MAPKRKKKIAGGAKSSEAAAAANPKDAEHENDKDPLAILLFNIQQISKDKSRCTDLLQAFNDESCTVLHPHDNNNKTDHLDCYWILLATHYIQRMVTHLETHEEEDSVIILLAAISHALAMALYSDKTKLEKSAGKTGVVRSALGRAIMSVTIGSTSALQHLEHVTEDLDVSLIRRAAWSAVTALEIVVNHSAPKSTASTSSDGWNHAQYWLWQDAANLDEQHEEDFVEICQAASNLLGISKEEHACLEALVGTEADAQAPPTPSKRRRAARKDTDVVASSSAIAAPFKSLLQSQVSSIMIDGRVSVRRWASMSFVWFCQGQQRLLEFVDHLLTNDEYWNSVLDCPAVIGLKDAPAAKKTSSKKGSRGKRSAAASEVIESSPPVHIPGNVSTVALASRLIAIVSDTGSTCGIRAPTGGMDTYAALVLGLVGNSGGKGRGRAAASAASLAENLPAWKRPDVRNLASVVIYKLVQAHTACLRKNCTSTEAFGCVLVNDDSSSGFAASVPMGATRPLSARFYPTVYKSVKSLCFAAASSGGDSTNVSDSTKRLLGIASAFILASGEQIRNIVDAKLYGVAISHLSDCLRNITSDDDRTNGPRAMDVDSNENEEARHSRLIDEYNLVEPLPTPDLPSTKTTRKRKKKKSDTTPESSICIFGGMFPQDAKPVGQQQTMSDEELLSFLIRAVQSSSDEIPPSGLFTELIEIVRCCYDLKEPSFEASTEDADAGSKRKGRKRGASSKAAQGKRKRKKVSTDAAEVSQNDEGAGRRTAKNMMSPRATLATDSLNALRMMVSHIPPTSSATFSRRELREFLRETLSTEQICSVVDLNRMINEALIESHVAMKAARKTPVGEDASSTFFLAAHSGSFRPYEKLLWTAHIKLCDTIGKGQSIYDTGKKGLLGDSNQRLAIFRAIAVSSSRKVPVDNASKSTRVPGRWPLSLPPAQHALVMSSLTSNPIEGQDNFSPERFLTQSFMSSIMDALGDPSILRAAEWHKSSLDFIGSENVVSGEDVPLSVRDAHLFVLGVTRLPRNEQMEFLRSFVEAVSSAVCKLKSSPPQCALFEEDADVSGFLARVVTTCVSLVNLVTVGSPLRNVFVSQIYPSHYAIPTLVAVDDMNPPKRLKEFDWYRKASSFVSLFSDWESPVVPNVSGTANMNIELSDELVSKLRSLHESSIQLGFASAKADRCHLLYSAWNASGRQASWDKKSASLKVDTSAAEEERATRSLLEFREDICALQRELHGNETLFPNSLLTRILKERFNAPSAPGQLKSKLDSMMAKAETIVDSILSSQSSSERQKDPSLVSFALLEALPTYIAFIMAAHTRSNESKSILMRESGRANVYDDDSASSNEEYADERVDTLMRLNDACDAFGAAPLQPDWLDDGCSLRDGITADDATRLAHRAMKCLEKLLSTAREECIKSSSQALSSSIATERNSKQRVDVALTLCLPRVGANTADDSNTGEGEAISISARLDEAIASFCGLETWQAKMFSNETNCMNLLHARESFCQHAVQTILGGMHTRHESFEGWDPSPAEYRVCGDWEYLLSEALLGACCNMEFPEESSPSNDFRHGLNTAVRWARIQEACTAHFMPVAALLRFGLSGGVGRQRHPLLNPVIDGGEEIKISSAMNLCDPLPESTSRTSREGVNDSILRTLSALTLASCSDLSDFTHRACVAVGSNVVTDSKAFSQLESMEALRLIFETIGQVRELFDKLEDKAKDRALSGSYVVEQLLCAVVKHGTLIDEGTPRRHEELYSFLGGRPFIVDTIVTTGNDYASFLLAKNSGQNMRQIQDLAVSNLIGVLSGDDVTLGTWSLVAEILGGLAGSEKSRGDPKQASTLSSRLVKALNENDDSFFQKLANWIICRPTIDIRPEDDATLQKISTDLCSFVTFAVGAARPVGRKQAGDFKGARIIFDVLLESTSEWLWLEPRVSNDVMSLVSVLGARYNTLHTIGSRLLSIMKEGTDVGGEKEYAVPVERFFRFLRDLDSALAAPSETSTTLSSKHDRTTENTDALRSSGGDGQSVADDSSANTVPDACSYVRQSGFHQQYWYNCYTCNLVWDKGCCTLCALRCHQDHDVSYSRYSSFFCDCGGEAPSESETRVPCKCLTAIDSHEAEAIFEGQRWPVIDQFPEVSECSKSVNSNDPVSDDELYSLAVAVASTALEQQSRTSLEKLKKDAETQSWTKELFEALRKSQNHWQTKSAEQVVRPESVDVVMSSPARSAKDRIVDPSARGRRGKVLKLRKLDRLALVPIRGVRSGAFKLSLSNDSASDRMKRATLAKNGVRRRAIVIDSRGRMIVSEPCSLLFCSALPPINVRYEDKSSELLFGRGQLSILGSTSMNFGIVGMELCRDNERHLLAWGTGEASVLILAKSCHKTERKIELKFDLESDEVDFLIKCKWIPGSQTMVAVICGLSVKIFDIRQAEGDKVTSVVSYTLAYEALLRDAALVPTSETSSSSAENEPAGARAVSETVKLYLLLDIGQVLDLVLRFDENGLQEQGDMYIESGEGMSLPVGGVRVNPSSQPASTGSMTRSLGEGSILTYLPESSVLLYACTSSPVLALLLDDRGNVSGSFELLPYIIKSDVLGTGSDGYSVHGPYTRFTELGYAEYDGIKYFRIVCVGKSSRTNQAKILCIDYNENAVRVKEIPSTGAAGIPGMSTTSAFDGLAAFSAPILKTAMDTKANFKQADFMERAYLCAITSAGAMAMFGEELLDSSPSASTTAGTSEKRKPWFPLTLFERLVNVSDSENLVFAGDRIGSSSDADGAKVKLSPNNSSYFMCPSREGCTITLSLKDRNAVALSRTEPAVNQEMLSEHSLCKSVKDQLVIVALRLLVGSTTTEFIPKYISVEGRRVWLQPDLKKHYDLPLTAEEIASALRNGFVTLGIGPSFDSGNNPLLDSIEVYAAKREQISHWLPLTCSQMRKGLAGGDAHDVLATETAEQLEAPAEENRLALSMTSITHLLQVLRTSSALSPEANEIVRQVIEATALKDVGALRQSLTTMLSCIETDPCRQKVILDEGVLAGVSKDLRCANEILASTAADRWTQVRETMKNCLRVAAGVAGERPGNYKSVVETLLQKETEESSLAVTAAYIVSNGLEGGFEWQDLVPELVELSLTESLLFPGRNEGPKETFASFEVLARLVSSPDNEIVNECCKSILDYWVQNLSRPTEPVVSYQCDACSLFPIKGVRYTFPDGGSPPGQEIDIDLCSDCFCLGRDYAAQHRYDSGINVKIKGKTIGKSTKLSCACLGKMKRIAIPASWLVDADSHSASTELENFSSVLFIDLVGLLSDRLEDEKLDFSLIAFQSLVDLVLDLVRNTHDESIMLSRAKEFAESVLTRIPRLVGLISADNDLEEESRSVLMICTKGLASLAAIKNDHSGRSSIANNFEECSVEDITPTKSKDKTDPRFVCEVHGVPAVRRRCSHGEHKNRRFYVCGMDRTCRCGYFKWADTADGDQLTAASNEANCTYSDEIGRFIWGLMSKRDETATQSICVLLRELIERDMNDPTRGVVSLSDEDCTEVVGIASTGQEKMRASSMPSRYDRRAAALDYVDGVFCAQEKLKFATAQNILDDSSLGDDSLDRDKDTLFTIALDLLSLVADASLEENEEQNEREPSGWLPLLCESSSTNKSPRYRALAKRALKRFCGGRREVYQSIRDHFIFAFQFRKLLRAVEPALQAGLNVKEQARQCGMNWRTGTKATFTSLPVGGLVGTSDLISEDCVTVSRGKTIGSTLDQLLSIAKSRGKNWRNFCGLETLPSQSTRKASSSGDGSTDTDIDSALLSVSPAISLFWIASVLSSKNQIKVLRLVDIALSNHPPRKLPGSAQKPSTPLLESRKDGRVETGTTKSTDTLLSFCTPSSLPENILLEGDKALLADEVHGFAVQFVVAGNSSELRKGAGKVVRKLSEKFEDDDFEWLFAQLTNRAFSGLPELGTTCIELLRLLQTLAASDVPRISDSPLLSISRNVVDVFTSQLRLMSRGKTTDLFVQQGDKGSKGPSEENYDFTSCIHCQRARNANEKSSGGQQQQQSDSGLDSQTTRASRSTSTPVQDSAMLPEQIRPFSRESLDYSTDATVSTEFSTYVQLKCRLAVSDIHVSIGDPRGRYVKTIAVYFSPRHVSDANILKSDGYANKWQRCATISLPRGATRASCSISPPIIAANLQIHYEEFYERPGGSRAEDGSPLLHCPRCTRVVSNAHGVCGHCGEVAFQCRKCRHINYLSLDAFLCVECGYCSTASFSYELTCGAASNAVAVMDDDSYQRSLKVLQVATKLREELRGALNDRLRPSSGKRSLSVHYGPSLKRSFLGELPQIRKEKKESGNSSSSTGRDESTASTASNRARSLLRLARQLRGDASSDRSRVGDLLVRQSLLGASGSRGISIDGMEELDSDVVGFLSGDAEGSDPLSRLVASIQGRQSSRSGSARDASSGGDGANPLRSSTSGNDNAQEGAGETTEVSPKATIEECDRLYQLMREAERECYELQRRINAWKRLENDALVDLGTAENAQYSFSPSECSSCGGPLAQQVLSLFMALFESNAEVVQSTITQNFVQALFDESVTMGKGLFDAKRTAIVSLATKSEIASKLILEQLRLRLKGSRDAASGEIMGKIIAVDSPLGEGFVELAEEILASGY